MALAACGNPNKGKTIALSSPNDVYGMGAVSSVRLLGSNMPASAVKSFSAVNAAAKTRTCGVKLASAVADTSENEVKEQSEKFNEYFTALDSFLGDDVVSTTTVANTDSSYDYETKMTVNGKDFNGATVTYTMYYTETLVKTNTTDENEETESEYQLTGVMVIDGVDYYLEGERSEENEKDESETELKIRAYADKEDKTSYIQMEQEYSVENGETETEYVYSIYVGGELLEQTAVEFETEDKDGKVETEYELEFRKGTSKGKYIVEREVVENKAEIKVKYAIDGKSGEFRIREITDKNGDKRYEYSYSDGSASAFDEIYNRTRKSVYYVALSILRDKALAEDVMQTTYMRVLKNIQRYALGTNASAWIIKIAKNEAINIKKVRMREQSVDEYENVSLFGVSEPDTYGELTDLAKRLLSDDEFSILMLVTACGYKRKEIAKMIDMPIPTVTWKYQNALSKMRTALEKEGC